MPKRRQYGQTVSTVVAISATVWISACERAPQPGWLAGDHHIHSQFSVGWDRSTDPPTPLVGEEGIYSIPMNAVMAREFGLDWMVSTDHGGPNHSKVNLELAYPELLASRKAVPEVIQFYGMELDTPGAEHSSLIIPHTHDEAHRLYELESGFSRNDPHPRDPTWDTRARMLEALAAMRELPSPPLLIANHPSRSAPEMGVYGANTPEALRDWNDTAPRVATGMSAVPGHQASTLNPDGSIDPRGYRAAYSRAPTMGGFDQMTARLGGFWDSMLGEGRHWWITANSDSHVNWREGGADFWPGEYSRTYVFAEKAHDAILAALRAGRVFVTTGDLISELYVTAEAVRSGAVADIGGHLSVDRGSDVLVTVRFLDPTTENNHKDRPSVARVDVIAGAVTGPAMDRALDSNPTARVVGRYTADSWEREGDYWVIRHVLPKVDGDGYIRVRGTNTDELEPQPDPRGEDPWTDLWFYSNPVFLDVR